jgi:hypothetical protein
MAAGCVPDANVRREILQTLKKNLREALSMLAGLQHPDDDERLFEAAVAKMTENAGQREGDFIDRSVQVGYTDLLEHYFS